MKNHASLSQQAELPPKWDLSDLYQSMGDSELEADIARSVDDVGQFVSRFKGKLPSLSAKDFAAALGTYEAIYERLGKIASYGHLAFAADTTNAEVSRFSQMLRERLTDIDANLLFFTLEINQLSDQTFAEKCSDNALRDWATFLERMRIFRPYQLSEEVEQALLQKSVTGRDSWVRLFDETMAALTVTLDGQTRPIEAALNQLSDMEREKRRIAAEQVGRALASQERSFVLITNTLAKDKAIEDNLRGLASPEILRHLSNFVEPEVVDALVDTVDANYARLSHRYYRLKAKWLGLDRMEHWDRNAPIPGMVERHIPWSEAKQIVGRAYHDFDPRLGVIASTFFENQWIDAQARPGKAGGAFAHPTVPQVHPYILMNYHGKPRDVATLAHEVGHGVHQILAAKQGCLRASTPLTLAETASVFGEMLTFDALCATEKDPRQKRCLIASKVEDMLNTVVRQIAFYQFEKRVHLARREGELSPQRLGQMWRDVQKRCLGDAFDLSPDYDAYWSYIPHFIHSPFYVYAYAFADCLVNALWGVYQSGLPQFKDKYIALLEAGGTQSYREALAPFGLDPSDQAFWQTSLNVISSLIDALESTDAAHGRDIV